MGRNKTNTSRDFFTYNQIENRSICDICNSNIKGNHAANLERHLKRHHSTEFENVQQRKRTKLTIKLESPNTSLENNSGNSDRDLLYHSSDLENLLENKNIKYGLKYDTTPNSSISKKRSAAAFNKYVNSDYLEVNLNKEMVLRGCVELITVNGCSFEVLEYSGFKTLLNPIVNAIGNNFSITSENIKLLIPEMAFKIMSQISIALQKKMISLKIDIVTHLKKVIMGINAQLIINGKISVFTLEMTELKYHYTMSDIRNVVEKVLFKYSIDSQQIYSVSIDYGDNLIKYVNFFKETEDKQMFQEESTCDETVCFDNDYPFKSLVGIKCAAHVLQVAIRESINSVEVKEIINDARELVKKCLNISFLPTLKEVNFNRLVLDSPSKWITTYFMIKILLENKVFISSLAENSSEYLYEEDKWEKLCVIVQTLQPVIETSMKLQTSHLTLSDFYGLWVQCKIKVRNSKNFFSDILLKHLSEKETSLLQSNMVLGAVYLDPRFKILLSKSQKEQAVQHLKLIWNKLQLLEKKNFNDSGEAEVESPLDMSDDTIDDLEDFLRSKELAVEKNRFLISTEETIEFMLNNFDYVQRLDKRTNILEFWEENKNTHPHLFKIAMVVLGTPATQTSVERAFSALQFVLQDNRNSDNENTLEDILIIRANFHLF